MRLQGNYTFTQNIIAQFDTMSKQKYERKRASKNKCKMI